jgi:hypothetical protein
MIKFCLEKWDANKNLLEKYLRDHNDLNSVNYIDLVKMVVGIIFNTDSFNTYEVDKITEIDNGDYQGTLLYLIPNDSYQPYEGDYLMTYVGYGSCSGCDTLQNIQRFIDYNDVGEVIADFMTLCKDIVSNTIRPYNHGWRHDPMFDTVDF